MSNTNALATRQHGSLLPDAATWGTMIQMAEALFKSGLLPSSIKSPQAAVAVIQKGTELGIPPMAALTSIVVIQGKPTANAELMLALIYRDHGDNAIVFTHSDNTSCVVAYKRRSWTKPQTYEFTMADAQKASLLGNQTWQKYPAAMLRARCISAVARMAFPDSIGGMHTPEEIGADVDVVDGEVVVINGYQSPQPEWKEVPATVEFTEPLEPRGIVDVLSDELADDLSPELANAYDMLHEAQTREQITELALYMDQHGLRSNDIFMDAYTARWEQITGKKAPRSTGAASDAQMALGAS